MELTDSEDFLTRLLALADLFDKKLSPTTQQLYFEALRDLPHESVAGALNAATKACTFMPKPAEVRRLAIGDDEDQAELAWLACKQAMGQAGAYASIATEDAALGETILAVFGSWAAACALDLSPEMWSSKRKEFGRVYHVYRGRAWSGARYLQGICEQQNAGHDDWRKYVPVAVIGAGGALRLLAGDEADTYRMALAAGASRDFSRLTSGAKAIDGPA